MDTIVINQRGETEGNKCNKLECFILFASFSFLDAKELHESA